MSTSIPKIIPIRPAATPTADHPASAGFLRRTLGRNLPSRRTLGRNLPSRRTLGINHP